MPEQNPNHPISPAPRRDKFASMAAIQRQKEESPISSNQNATATSPTKLQHSATPMELSTFTDAALTAAPAVATAMNSTDAPRRGKFARLAAVKQSSTMNTDTTSLAMGSTTPSESTAAAAAAAVETTNAEDKKRDELQRRMCQRDSVLQDLEQAEALTWKLLTLASSTTRALSNLTGITAIAKDDITKTSNEYRDTLQQIHSVLTPHAHLVVPYQNHKVDDVVAVDADRSSTSSQNAQQHQQKQQQQQQQKEQIEGEKTKTDDDEPSSINMYAARVEMRLAIEKKHVLAELLRLERPEEKIQHQERVIGTGSLFAEEKVAASQSDDTRKRPRED